MRVPRIALCLFILILLPLYSRAQPVDIAVHEDRIDVVRHGHSLEIAMDPFAVEALFDSYTNVEGEAGFILQSLVYGDDNQPVRVESVDRRTEGVLLHGKAGDTTVQIQLTHEGDMLRFDVMSAAEAPAPVIVLANRADEHYFGLGDYWGPGQLDMRGHAKRLWVRTGTPDECAYVPFYLSTGGYGLFLDDPRATTFDFGASNTDEVCIQTGAPNFTFYVFLGPMHHALKQYQELTGFPYMPPRWTFTPQKWRNEGNWDAVWEDVNDMREHDIPVGVVWIDRPWALGDYGAADFEFDPERYPNPQENIDKLHELGIRVLVWGCDATTPDAKNVDVARENGYLANDSASLLRIDFTDPEAREWWKSEINKVLEMGIDGFKLDRGQSLPGNADHHTGWDHNLMHNYHGYLMTKTYAEALQEARGTDFQFTPRASWSGNHQYTMKWPGDMASTFSNTNGLGACVIAQQSAAMTGFGYWGSDIGGFEHTDTHPTKECFIRWVQFGAFSPVMQTCGKKNHNRAPFSFDEETVQIYRWYAKLRMEMLPYIEAMAETTSQQGLPMVRPLALQYQGDENTYTIWDEYMFGSHFLVAPILSEHNKREVYLPKTSWNAKENQWMDFWNPGQVYEGGQTIEVEAPLDRIPLFVRYPFVLPLEVVDNTCGNGKVVVEGATTVLVGGEDAHFGWGGNDNIPRWRISADAREEGLALSHSLEKAVFRIFGEKGREVRGLEERTLEELNNGQKGWWQDEETGDLWVVAGFMDRDLLVQKAESQ